MTQQVDKSMLPGRVIARAPIVALALLAGCRGHADDGKVAGTEVIACRSPGKPGFAPACTLERMASPDGTVLTVRQPDGGFRRLLVVKDGRGVIAADGVDPVRVSAADKGSIDVEAGGTVFRLPATVTP